MRSASLIFTVSLLASSSVGAADDKHFADKVLPVLKAKCFACHGDDPKKLKGGLDLRSRAALLKGGDSGKPTVVPGKPGDSPLYLAVTRRSADWSAMPPKENDRLRDAEVSAVRDWVAAGAPWPSDERLAELRRAADQRSKDGVVVKTTGGLSPDWTNRRYKPDDLWAFRPVVKPAPPNSAHRHPIDAFLAAGSKVPPAPPAGRRALIRRVTFGLTGLPPTPAEVEAFVNDPTGDDVAFGRVLDRLLASPHHGERMAAHWLDVARYADSSGFAYDYERGNAWRYRAYVARAFNADVPYDRFVKDQIAGDEIDPADPERLVAVGFLRMGPWELTGMEVPKVARQRFLDDVTDAVGQTFLAQPLQCARCHDHKFDPIPTRALGRAPTAGESKACLAHWRAMTARHAKLTFPRTEYPKEITRVAVEENTGERFSFVEPLEMMADFVPDLQPAECPPDVRGLAEVCLVLFNTNEFAYVE
jgi:hypothetical protein